MRVFLTGATGNIGGAVARNLIKAGHTVIGVARSDSAAARLTADGITPYQGDLTSPESLVAGAQQAEAVINTGAARAYEMDRGDVERRVVETLLNALEGTGKPFIYTSDQLIYGSTEDGIADEHTPLNPPPFLAWRPAVEQMVLAAKDRGVRASVIRPVAVYGEGRDQLMPMMLPIAKQLGAGFYIGDGLSRWSLVHRDDLGDLYVRVLEQAPAGTLVNASAEPPVSMRELGEAISYAAGYNGKTVSLPVEQAMQTLGMFATNFSHSLVISGEKARREFGWQPKGASVIDDAKSGVYAPLLAQQAAQ